MSTYKRYHAEAARAHCRRATAMRVALACYAVGAAAEVCPTYSPHQSRWLIFGNAVASGPAAEANTLGG
jgi:hypothetical protein